MIRVTSTNEKYSFIWIFSIIFTAVLHIGFFLGSAEWADSVPRKTYASSRVDFRTIEPTKPVHTDVKNEPEPQKPEPPLTVKQAKKISPKVVKRRPKSNASTPKQEAIPDPKSNAEVKPVFGATANSVVGGTGGVAIRVGNTLEKEMEATYTKPQKVAPLPPADKEPPPPQQEKKNVIPKPVPVYELSKAPTFKNKIEPNYPEQARRAGIEGVVQLETLIDEQGRVRKIKVLKTPGHGLEKAAIQALSKSRFHPGVVNGKPVPVKIKIPYRFVLDA